MSRSGYSESLSSQELNMWRGAVDSAIRGKRGQSMFLALRDALDAMPEKKLIAGELVSSDGECCALGCLAQAKNINVEGVDPEDRDEVGKLFNIAPALAAEIVYENDEAYSWIVDEAGNWTRNETPEHRWQRMRDWVEKQIAVNKEI